MGFFNAGFLLEKRLEWKNSLEKFQYQVAGTWHDATVSSSEIEGNKLVYSVIIPSEPETAHIITGIRILDKAGKEAGSQELHIERGGTQSLLAVFEIPIQEV